MEMVSWCHKGLTLSAVFAIAPKMDDLERCTESFWLKRAREVRTASECALWPETKRALAFIAKCYERLARMAKERTAE
jgi:hypothetical protein